MLQIMNLFQTMRNKSRLVHTRSNGLEVHTCDEIKYLLIKVLADLKLQKIIIQQSTCCSRRKKKEMLFINDQHSRNENIFGELFKIKSNGYIRSIRYQITKNGNGR